MYADLVRNLETGKNNDKKPLTPYVAVSSADCDFAAQSTIFADFCLNPARRTKIFDVFWLYV